MRRYVIARNEMDVLNDWSHLWLEVESSNPFEHSKCVLGPDTDYRR